MTPKQYIDNLRNCKTCDKRFSTMNPYHYYCNPQCRPTTPPITPVCRRCGTVFEKTRPKQWVCEICNQSPRPSYKRWETDLLTRYLKRLHSTKRVHCLEKGIDFNIGLGELESIAVEKCIYIGVDLIYFGNALHPHKACLDRIIPSRGYTTGNCQFISRMANTMKSDFLPEQLLLFARGVLRVHGS